MVYIITDAVWYRSGSTAICSMKFIFQISKSLRLPGNVCPICRSSLFGFALDPCSWGAGSVLLGYCLLSPGGKILVFPCQYNSENPRCWKNPQISLDFSCKEGHTIAYLAARGHDVYRDKFVPESLACRGVQRTRPVLLPFFPCVVTHRQRVLPLGEAGSRDMKRACITDTRVVYYNVEATINTTKLQRKRHNED